MLRRLTRNLLWLNGHIDPYAFIRRKVYLKYAEQFLDPDQIDLVDESKTSGCVPQARACSPRRVRGWEDVGSGAVRQERTVSSSRSARGRMAGRRG